MRIDRPILHCLQAQHMNNITVHHRTVTQRAIIDYEVQKYNTEEAEKPVIIL